MTHTINRPFYTALGLFFCFTASPALVADSVGPSVYGRFNVSVDKSDHRGAMQTASGTALAEINTVDHWELKSNASNFGIKGSTTMDIPNLDLIYQVELGIDIDGKGRDILSQRNTFIGFQHQQFGTLKAGRFDTPLKRAEGKVDQFNNIRGDLDVLLGGQNRRSNIVQYSSPALADSVVINAAVVLAENDHNDDDEPNGLSASMVYEHAWLYAAMAYDRNINARRSVDGITGNSNAVRAVIKLDFEQLEAGMVLQQNRDTEDNSDLRDDAVLVNAAWKIDKLKIKAQHGQSRGKQSRERGRLNAVGADYRLGKRTFVFAYYARLKLEQSQLRDSTLAAGLQHSF